MIHVGDHNKGRKAWGQCIKKKREKKKQRRRDRGEPLVKKRLMAGKCVEAGNVVIPFLTNVMRREDP